MMEHSNEKYEALQPPYHKFTMLDFFFQRSKGFHHNLRLLVTLVTNT